MQRSHWTVGKILSPLTESGNKSGLISIKRILQKKKIEFN